MESLLKKDFNRSDVERIRNLVKKDFTSGTKIGVGYEKVADVHNEGDVWEQDGKTWTIKNGLKQSITKLDAAKKAIQIPLSCPKCGGPMKHHLAKKMYKIHGFCFDPCTVNYETSLRKAGLYNQYEKRMIQGNLKAFISDIESWVLDQTTTSNGFVTEQGDVEDWKSNTTKDAQAIQNVQDFISQVKKHLE